MDTKLRVEGLKYKPYPSPFSPPTNEKVIISSKEDLVEDQYSKTRFKKNNRLKIKIAIFVTLITAALISGLIAYLIIGLKYKSKDVEDNTSSPSLLGNYSKAAVAVDNPVCSKIANDVLIEGGSAADASVAALICIGLMNSHSAGIGGGFLMTIYDSQNGTAKFIDARESAPAAAFATMYHGNASLSQTGWLAIAVPGEIKGLWEVHRHYGKLPWARLLEPTIDLCMNGYEIYPALGNTIESNQDKILSEPNMYKLLYNSKTGTLAKTGDIIYNPELGKTLQRIANETESVLYNGILGKEITDEIQKEGGIITMKDLQSYRVLIKDAISIKLKTGLTVFAPRLPGSGIILQYMLKILDGYNLAADIRKNDDKKVLMYQRLVETMKFAYARRSLLGDIEDQIIELIQNMTSDEEAERTRSFIKDDQTFNPDYYGIDLYNPDNKGTTHVSVMDENGLAVAVSSTINTYFGSFKRSSNSGIIFNNEMDDFASPNITNFFGIPPSAANFIKPGKRPLSSMSPTIIVNGTTPILILGASGGTRITTSILQVIMNVIWLNMNIKEAIDEPRLHHQLLPNILYFENFFPKKYLDRLKSFGHKLDSMALSVVQGIHRGLDGRIYANCDYRKGGAPNGY